MNRPQSLRKVAVLIDSLDAKRADALLERMSTEQRDQVRRSIMELVDISDSERSQVIAEFLGQRGAAGKTQLAPPSDRASSESGGPSSRRSAPASPADADVWLDWSPAATRASREPATLPGRFGFLNPANARRAARLLEQENPRAVAIVVAQLPPQVAADVVAAFSPATQARVLEKLAAQEKAESPIVGELEEHLRLKLQGLDDGAGFDWPNARAVGEILAAVPAAEKERMQRSLARERPDLARLLGIECDSIESAESTAGPESPEAERSDRSLEVTGLGELSATPVESKAMSNSTDDESAAEGLSLLGADGSGLERLDEHSIAALLQRADPQTIFVALAAAPPNLVKRLLRHLPRRERRHVYRQLSQIGPLRIADIDLAFRRLNELASTLAAEGVIRWPRPRSVPA